MDPFIDALLKVAIPVVSTGIIALFTAIWRQLKKADKYRKVAAADTQQRFEAIEEGLESIKHTQRDQLKDRLMQSTRYWLDRGYCPVAEREILEALHTDYHDWLDGNGIVTKRVIDVMELPERKD